jgi:chromosome segregation ATPase
LTTAEAIEYYGKIIVTVLITFGLIVAAVIIFIARVQSALAEARKMTAEAQKKAADAQTKTAADMPAQVGNHVANQLRDQLGSFLDVYTSTTDGLKGRIAILENDLKATQKKLDQTESDFTHQRIIWEADLKARDTRISSLEHEISDAKIEIERVKTDRDSQLVIANNTIDDLEKKLKTAQSELEITREDMRKLQERVLTLERQVADMDEERKRIVTERDQAVQDRDVFKTRAETAEDKALHLQAALDDLLLNVDRQANELTALRTELATLRSAPEVPQP